MILPCESLSILPMSIRMRIILQLNESHRIIRNIFIRNKLIKKSR